MLKRIFCKAVFALVMLPLFMVALLLVPLFADAQSYPSPTFQNVTVRGTLTAATPAFTNPVPVASGGTNCSAASGTCLDNITGFASTGFLTRTGSGTYAFQSLTNGITYANLAQAGANTLLGNATGSTANVAAVTVTGCNGAAQALQWTNGSGFGCNSSIATSGANANITSLSGLSTPLSVSQGGTGGATLAQYQPLAGSGTSAITTLGTGTVGQVLTSNGPSAYPSFQAIGALSGKNRIINGTMSVDQRNSGASQTITAGAALAYTVDRWYAYCTGANVTGQRVAGSGSSQYRYQFTGAASVTGIGFGQRIETLNSYDLNNATATLSVDLADSVLTTVTWTAYYANSTDSFGTLASPTRTQIATGTFTVNSTITRYSTQISIPSAATTGIEIVFSVGSQTSGTWTIGNVQLEAGSAATTFERRPYGTELELSQRYYRQLGGGVSGEPFGTGFFQGASLAYVPLLFPVRMRVAPTLAAPTGTFQCSNGSNSYSVSGFAASGTTVDGTLLNLTVSGATVNAPCVFTASNTSATITISSEL